MYKEITQKIIDLLAADTNLKKGKIIAEYYFGKPVQMRFPCIYVEFEGGPVANMAIGSETKRRDHAYRITVAHRLTKEDAAEKFAYDKAELIEANIKTNKTLGGLVTSAVVTDVLRVDDLTDVSLKQVRVTIRTLKMA